MHPSLRYPSLTTAQLEEAIAGCESEPIHIPGIVQPFGCLIAVERDSGLIKYASVNTHEIIGLGSTTLLNADFGTIFGREIVHALRNAASYPAFDAMPRSLGQFTLNNLTVETHAFAQGHFDVVEFETAKDVSLGSDKAFDTLSLMIETIQTCETETKLFEHFAELMQHITGYDRIMVYKFDPDYNGEVVAEVKRRRLEPFLGLRFPSNDIPAQAREMMRKVSLRFIEDVDQMPVPLIAAGTDLPPLDISLAETRGVSPVHMQYLRNMGVAATMTLSIMIQDKLWGLISFHHTQPKTPPAGLRWILRKAIGLFCTKLESLHQNDILAQIKSVDDLKETLIAELDENTNLDASFADVAPIIAKMMQASGVTVMIDEQIKSYGTVPKMDVINALLDMAYANDERLISITQLATELPHMQDRFSGVAGALVFALSPRSSMFFFRPPIEKEVSWAGQPAKETESISGQMRLKPRSSFTVYLQSVSDACATWTEKDTFLAKRIWPIINSEERRALVNTINRQQAIMINELNHRVRNVLSLVRSVSRQVGRSTQTDRSYSDRLEARIQALATAHDMAFSATIKSVSIQSLIQSEIAPYTEGEAACFILTGSAPNIRADTAPIFSLVIHELTTNAVKYGALSTRKGCVRVSIQQHEKGYEIEWVEGGGPTVVAPKHSGFGSTLIKEAIPHELKGQTELLFEPGGLIAKIFLPFELFDDAVKGVSELTTPDPTPAAEVSIPDQALSGIAMVLEDNYVIAKEMSDQLEDFGFSEIFKFSKVEDALEFLTTERPAVAVFDIHLGDGMTSIEAALQLIKLDIPFIFVTGYGEMADLPAALVGVPVLKKPIENGRLRDALAKVFSHKIGNQQA